ncbi:MAG TPA: hypothetical protein VMU85_22860 [Stellaceae bacterium]|nr:hypothetical protein [Stellaceae bacterium]
MSQAKDADFAAISEDVASLKRDLASLMDHIKKGSNRTAQDLYNGLAAESERSVKAISRQVEEQPLTSLLIAFGIGIVSGRLLSR